MLAYCGFSNDGQDFVISEKYLNLVKVFQNSIEALEQV